ncbi:hypothetical protein SRHO_G00191590 [Serrasalmus rhombeus]
MAALSVLGVTNMLKGSGRSSTLACHRQSRDADQIGLGQQVCVRVRTSERAKVSLHARSPTRLSLTPVPGQEKHLFLLPD